ncbi:Uncharacterised protein [Mycobacteroides abscessus subsp. abscessus]|uniref:replication-relaxation family protein n=1 Tax=Mycobacteroides abscessus TaxID=36809 RepID=UPI00092B7166|nr:replication-relaxation family protein [Mycobacteroides abscessus]SHV15279.1 Uncharacterised protein [Mycobacteroides abscessus subsp. abscessus]SKD11179.1 Uncharacterised protein [Mycobacteroides abscessus subsp. abscessus]SKL38084.1 Uncharacterised protein [Mycobacteroides abscessus subsp. abscessus]SKM28351.1 Uncharacterised protein [Mycobacteroides abscessus subsp. abscessus]
MSWQDNQAPDGSPIGAPIGSSEKQVSTSTNSLFGAPNGGAHTGTTPERQRRKQRMKSHVLEEIAAGLSDREFAILRSVAEHQFLTVRQVEALHFADHAPGVGDRLARRSLAKLRRQRLLGALSRRIGGVRAGSAGMVHYVDAIGQQLLNKRSGRRPRGFREPSQRFVNHRVAVAGTHVTLVEADREACLELVECYVEPTSWRRFPGIGGARLTLKPDLYAETALPSDSDLVHAWFVEVDLGTESIPTLLKKCRDYESYRRTGIEQDHDGSFPLVVWSMTHAEAAKAIQRRLALQDAIDADRSLTSKLFRVIAPDQLVPLLARGGAI